MIFCLCKLYLQSYISISFVKVDVLQINLEFETQIKRLELWIAQAVDHGSSGISFERLTVLLSELQFNTVGVTVSVGFTITYTFVANVRVLQLNIF